MPCGKKVSTQFFFNIVSKYFKRLNYKQEKEDML